MKWVLSGIIGLIVILFSAAGEPMPGIVLAVIIGIIWGAFASAKSQVRTERDGVTTNVEIAGVGYVPSPEGAIAQPVAITPAPAPRLDETSAETQLLTLKSWFDRGLIGQVEYDAKKAEVLSHWGASTPRPAAPRLGPVSDADPFPAPDPPRLSKRR